MHLSKRVCILSNNMYRDLFLDKFSFLFKVLPLVLLSFCSNLCKKIAWWFLTKDLPIIKP